MNSQSTQPFVASGAERSSEIGVVVAKESATVGSETKRRRAPLVLFGLVGVAAAIAATSYWVHCGIESTDDAQVEGRVVFVSPRVTGQIARVLVQDNQLVEAGQSLVEIDRADWEARAAAARADLAAAKAAVHGAQAQLALTERIADGTLKQARGALVQARAATNSAQGAVSHATAEITAAEARRALAAVELHRSTDLVRSGVVGQTDLDTKQSAFDQAAAFFDQARARAVEAEATARHSAGEIEAAQGRLTTADSTAEQVAIAQAAVEAVLARQLQAESASRLAELNLSYTTITAPRRGIVSRRTAEEGQLAWPEKPLLAVVGDGDLWVVANFKEDQLRRMRAGQRSVVRLDTYGRAAFQGYVDSIGGAAGARFAVLPPDNASGNFIKVVQRIPVLIRLDEPNAMPLRPGMSATVDVDTR
jgi:membrane fusion protein (multidrug efflux system)